MRICSYINLIENKRLLRRRLGPRAAAVAALLLVTLAPFNDARADWFTGGNRNA